MKIFVWRHSKLYSSWSMFNEPHIYRDSYLQAEIVVLAYTKEEALDLIKKDEKWDPEELQRIDPLIINLEHPVIVSQMVTYA